MLKLIGLELKRNDIRTYVAASAISCIVILAFLYFVAYVAQVETGERELQFRNYSNIFSLAIALGLIIFSVMSAIIYSRLVIGEYAGKRAALLFSYPVSRRKILLAKLFLVVGFTTVSMLICTAIPFIVFSITEKISPIVVQDTMTAELIAETLGTLLIAVLAVGGIGIISMRIGFIKKSVPTTLISAFLLAAIYGNAAINAGGILPGLLISGIGLIAAIAVAVQMSNKVNEMEVE